MSEAEFDQLFAGSRAVVRPGVPEILFHGTGAAFDRFDPRLTGSQHVDLEVGPVFYFTDHRPTARYYARTSAKATGGKPLVMEVCLLMRNPLVVDFEGQGIELLGADLEKAKQDGHDGLMALNYDDDEVSNHYMVFSPDSICLAPEWLKLQQKPRKAA